MGGVAASFGLLLVLLCRPPGARSFDVPDLPAKRPSAQKADRPTEPTSLLRMLLVGLIRGYQATLSRVQGDVCNFTPSCSHFAVQAVERFGPIQGLLLASDRLQRCHYWAWHYLGLYYGVREVPGRGPKLVDPVERYP